MADEKSPLKTLKREMLASGQLNDQLCKILDDLEKRYTRYTDLFENAADAILLGDEHGTLIGANHSAATLTGYSVAELSHMPLSRLFSRTEMLRAPLRLAELRQGLSVLTERCLTRKDGSVIAVEMHSRVLPDGTYHSFVRDISERKKIEDALRISQEKFARAFRLSPDALTITRLEDGVYLEVNQGFSDILGWSADEVIGRSSLSDDLDIWCDPEDRERLVAGLRQTGEVIGFEAKFRSKDGRELPGLMSARLIEIDGELCNLAVSRDISGWLEAQDKQRKLEEQILQTQKLESLGILAGGIAHDFNNILMAVIGHCELAQRRLSSASPALDNLRQIKLAAGRAADLANQMLAYSGKGKFVIEPLNLSKLVEEMEHILAVSISKKAYIRYDLNDIPSVEGDATQLRQVIMNLVINASDAIGEGSGMISVTTGVMHCDDAYLQEIWPNEKLEPGHYVFAEVADTGCGIAADDFKRVFEPFYSTKFTGHGLGMAAVQGIVRSHKGGIKVYSELGRGSTFKVLLPASMAPVNQRNNRTEPPTLTATGTVLLVDDEEAVRRIGTDMLKELGFTVLTAVDGLDALKIFRECHADIRFVLMDLTMPNMDGEEAFREFRRIRQDIKVIICSGYNKQDVSQKFVGKGLAGFLKKPYQLTDLQKEIGTLLLDR